MIKKIHLNVYNAKKVILSIKMDNAKHQVIYLSDSVDILYDFDFTIKFGRFQPVNL